MLPNGYKTLPQLKIKKLNYYLLTCDSDIFIDGRGDNGGEP